MGTREIMVPHLKEIVVAKLREQGFKGSFPHFRRINSSFINLLSFQFDKWGGGFVIEIANSTNKDFTTSWGSVIPTSKLTVQDLHPSDRKRIQHDMSTSSSSTEDWFRFDNAITDNEYIEICNEVIEKLKHANKYWSID